MSNEGKRPPLLDGGRTPFLGHALEMKRDPVGMLARGRVKHGDIFRIKLPGADTVVMSGLKAHEAYFKMPDDVASQREVYQFMVPIFGKGIAYDATPEVMKEQMGFFFPALREARLRTYSAAQIEEAEMYFDKWENEGVVDLYEVGNELTIYSSSRCLLGQDFRKHLSKEFADVYQALEGGLTLLAFLWPYLPTPAHRRRDRGRARMAELIGKIVDERLANGSNEEDMLQSLMESKYADGRALTKDEITGLLLAIVFAGHHTSGTTFSWNQILLHQNPKYLARVLEEQDRVLENRDRVNIDDVRKMTLLERSIKETLRMYPPIIMVMRRVMKDFVYDGFDVPAGSMAMVSPAMSHRIGSIFKDPDLYDPDRYSPGREEDKQSPLAHIAFGGGRHRCLGSVFASLQLVAVSSVLLRRFELELVEEKYEQDYRRILVAPRQPCRVRFKRRKSPMVAVPGNFTSIPPEAAAPLPAAAMLKPAEG